MPTSSDLGYDPIIPHIHDTFMDHSPSGSMNLLEPSRTSPMKTSETFPNSEIGLPLYESYSLDHSGSPRDIPDPHPRLRITFSIPTNIPYLLNNIESLSVSPYGS